jgi:hypothetical protein
VSTQLQLIIIIIIIIITENGKTNVEQCGEDLWAPGG